MKNLANLNSSAENEGCAIYFESNYDVELKLMSSIFSVISFRIQTINSFKIYKENDFYASSFLNTVGSAAVNCEGFGGR